MRDIFFQEVETDSPEQYVRQLLKGKITELSVDAGDHGNVMIYVNCDGLTQKFIITPI